MVNLIIDGRKVSIAKGSTILQAATKAGIAIPHLCYVKGLNDIGACRVCVVEIDGINKLAASCNTEATEGMIVHTNSPRVRLARKTNVELILANHDCKCATCVRSGNCELQTLANNLCIDRLPFADTVEKNNWDRSFPLIREASKCIQCMRCVQVCDNIQDLHVWDVIGSGSRTTVGVTGNKDIRDAKCSLCGQCITHCPVGALHVRNDLEEVFEAIADPDKIVIAQIAPAIRTSWNEMLGLPIEEASLGKLVDALKIMGVDYVFDTNFTADLTIMEEGTEFLKRFTDPENNKLPMFTSCCPGWIRYVKNEYPDMVENLSTCKSPQQMFGAMIKTYVAEKIGVDPSKVYSVSIMPCVAKKWERAVDAVNDAGHGSDVDAVLTTREVARMITADYINPNDLTNVPFDNFFGEGSGAAVIFGVTGGVMEAALRSAYYLVTKENPPADAFHAVRGMDGWKEASFNIPTENGPIPVRVAVASGLGNTRKLIEAIRSGKAEYDFVEIMACTGGCSGGGGQPIVRGKEMAKARGEILYGLDKTSHVRFSHENAAVKMTYEEYLGQPLGHHSHELLHTDLKEWKL
jgi:NADP-reducing hydrogenase subunit HndD